MRNKKGLKLLVIQVLSLCSGCGEGNHRIYDSVTDVGEWFNVTDCIKTDDKGHSLKNVYGFGRSISDNINEIEEEINMTGCVPLHEMDSTTIMDYESLKDYYEYLYSKTPDDVVEDYPCYMVDKESFQICRGTEYAKDKNRVYHGVVSVALMPDSSNYRINRDGMAFAVLKCIPLYRLSPRDFKYIGEGFGLDRNNLYYNGVRIKWNDSIIRAVSERQRHRTNDVLNR